MEYTLSNLRPCEIIEGLEVNVQVGADAFRLVVAVGAFVERGADRRDPDTWRATLRAHEEEIVTAAMKIRRLVSGALVILRELPREAGATKAQ